MKRFVIFLLILTCAAAFSSAQNAGETFRQEGIASWYGEEFNGRPTASGEIFDTSLFTAAHPTLPFGTVLTVTNRQNNKKVTVRVNDRGPFVAARIIDLSMAAAEALDMLTTGTAPVIVEYAANTAASAGAVPSPSATAFQTIPQAVNPNPPAPPPSVQRATPAPVNAFPSAAAPVPVTPPQAVPAAPAVTSAAQTMPVIPAPPSRIMGAVPQAGSGGLYRIQVGAYTVPRNAVDAFDKLKGAGLNPAYERSGDYYRVVLSGLNADELHGIAQTLGNLGFAEVLLRKE